MPPTLALLLWLILLVALLCFDPARNREISPASWIAVIWIFFVASRLPSQWLGVQIASAAQGYQEGNSLDRIIFSVLMLLAIAVLVSRSFKWGNFFASNFALVTLVFFGLLSVFWSDFPLVCLKRWFRDLGNYLVVLVVLSDPRPLEAVRTVLRRFCFLLIPLSILLEKYYPVLGRQYDIWTGQTMIVGASLQKNNLGAVCLIGGIFFFWDTVTRWSNRRERKTKRIIMMNVAFLVMTVWLLYLTDSATSRVCFAIGCLVIVAVHSKWGRRHSTFVKVMLPTVFCLYLILAYGFDINETLTVALGRNPTLTDRTLLWKLLLSMNTNPLLGTGYASFWLGPRLQLVWRAFASGINEAHNGYLELYLDLGLIGVSLLVGLLIASYRSICKRLTPPYGLASLSLAFWEVALFYNMTEAAFKFHLIWITFLLAALFVPVRAESPRGAFAVSEDVHFTTQRRAFEPASLGRRWAHPVKRWN